MCKFTMIILSFKLQKNTTNSTVAFSSENRTRIWRDILFCTVESPKQFLLTQPLTISMQIWMTYETHIFKWGSYRPTAGPPMAPWLLFCLFVSSGEWYMQTETCANPWPWTLTSKLVVIWQPFCQFIHLVKKQQLHKCNVALSQQIKAFWKASSSNSIMLLFVEQCTQ